MDHVEQLKEDVRARRIDADQLVEVLVTLEYRRFTDRLLEIYRAAAASNATDDSATPAVRGKSPSWMSKFWNCADRCGSPNCERSPAASV